MKEEALVITIDFGSSHFNAIHLNNQLKLIASTGRMITINDTTRVRAHEEGTDISTDLVDFFKR